MFSVIVKDHIMIAHSLPDPYFGPAAGLHGATYMVDAEFSAMELNLHNVVIDIGEASKSLENVLGELKYKNLDDIPEFKNILTTTEFLAKYIHDELAKTVEDTIHIKVTLHESHVASATYSGDSPV